MPRKKMLADDAVLEAAYQLIRIAGPDQLTFARMSEMTGLSASTLVQRFRTKAGLLQSALLRAWDQLDERTALLKAAVPQSPEGAIAMLVGLSEDYGAIEHYADGLMILREDLRDPVLRARGTAWKTELCAALDRCFADAPGAGKGMGLMMAAQWQGSLVWWGFDPVGRVEDHVNESLQRFIAALSSR
ncbi:TetR/AcrR family transcriptional regulator [Rhizobium sp. KVB221]|uniref:TetR/AcrR family transcriptional regulator n=1 Tax=Rhizobium setariae TaxID=2801340 RepID=A0A937CLN6_9HYPH|nr:TetR family transcriptional regulator [Rhizobium setariae]MBL0371856.1 TetR/AcrR family transcriptional regulator [Rhizobium setariae]